MTLSSRRSKKVWLTVPLALLLCGLVYVAFAKVNHWWPFSYISSSKQESAEINNTSPTEGQVNAGMDAKNDFEKTQTEASQQQTAAQTPTAADKQTVYVQLTNISVDGSTLRVRAIIQTIDASGTCKLTLAQSGSTTITQTATTQTMASYTSCQGFDIDKSVLASGKWTVTLEYTGSNNRSGTASKEVNL